MYVYKTFKIKLGDYDFGELDDTVAMVDTWYDRHQRIWVTQLKNKAGDQIGNAIYSFNRKDAMSTNQDLKAEYGIQ